MTKSMTPAEYRALAEFRHQIRVYLNGSERAARAAGLEPQQYLAMLAVRGFPPGQQATIRNLAERLQLQHHSVVELLDRLHRRGLARRKRPKEGDRRLVLVDLTARGNRLLARLASQRIAELRIKAPELVRALSAVIAATRPPRRSRRRRK